MFGRNLISSEGSDFRRHKKIVAPVFSEKSNALVFEESARQTEGILNFWAQKRGNTQEQMKITDTAPDVSLLALHVICGAGFGVPQTWPGEDETVLGTKVVPGFNTEKLLNQHEMTFKDSLDMVTAGFLWFALLPTSIMSKFNCISSSIFANYYQKILLFRCTRIFTGPTLSSNNTLTSYLTTRRRR